MLKFSRRVLQQHNKLARGFKSFNSLLKDPVKEGSSASSHLPGIHSSVSNPLEEFKFDRLFKKLPEGFGKFEKGEGKDPKESKDSKQGEEPKGSKESGEPKKESSKDSVPKNEGQQNKESKTDDKNTTSGEQNRQRFNFDNSNNNDPKKRKFLTAFNGGVVMAIALYLLSTNRVLGGEEFDEMVRTGKIKHITIRSKVNSGGRSYVAVLTLDDGKTRGLAIADPDSFIYNFDAAAEEYGSYQGEATKIGVDSRSTNELLHYAFGITVDICQILLVAWIIRRTTSSFNSLKKMQNHSEELGKTIKKFNVEKNVKSTFNDIAGCENPKLEMREFVDFLKNPEKYHKAGARLPKGALLGGPPGTGKTLMAKACAGESNVPFFYMSGSDFVEKYVGVGASRIRKLFTAARKEAPAIIFIDEIDAVGRQRSSRGAGERDSTLNQLLVEMDGFSSKDNVIIFAASNRLDILDNALKRPGRFDRMIEFSLPTREEREEIFKIHLKGLVTELPHEIIAKKMSPLCTNFSGADIKNICNEAAIVAGRNGKMFIEMIDFEKAMERVLGGLEKKILMTPEEKRLIAIHEAGKALVSWHLEYAPTLLKISIIPRSKTNLGFSQYLPSNDKLQSEGALRDIICYRLGGRCAEQEFFGEVTTGAQKDLEKCYEIATNIVTQYGMSKSLYNVKLDRNRFGERFFSDKTNERSDQEVEAILREEEARCMNLIKTHRSQIEALADKLLEKDTLEIIEIKKILGEKKGGDEEVKLAMKEVEERLVEREEKKKEDDARKAAQAKMEAEAKKEEEERKEALAKMEALTKKEEDSKNETQVKVEIDSKNEDGSTKESSLQKVLLDLEKKNAEEKAKNPDHGNKEVEEKAHKKTMLEMEEWIRSRKEKAEAEEKKRNNSGKK